MQVLFLQSHSTCFGRMHPSSGVFKHSVPALIRRCDDLPATITHVPVAAVLVLNTPDDGCFRPKHVEWPCRNTTCTVLHQFGVSFDSRMYFPQFFQIFWTSPWLQWSVRTVLFNKILRVFSLSPRVTNVWAIYRIAFKHPGNTARQKCVYLM